MIETPKDIFPCPCASTLHASLLQDHRNPAAGFSDVLGGIKICDLV